MSLNLLSIRDRVVFRVGHISVAYKQTVLLWGGSKEQPHTFSTDEFPSDELCIFDCNTETWSIRILSGDVPPKLICAGGAILGNALYIYGGYLLGPDEGSGDALYKLDLLKLKWEKLNPGGIKPVACNKLVAWAYGHRIYLFGGYGDWSDNSDRVTDFIVGDQGDCAWNNQLVAYNTLTNRWEWPETWGNRPLPRAAHACDISGSRVFIMGGRLLDERMNQLYCLNMETMRWSDNLIPEDPEPKPEGRSWHSLNFITPDKAVVYGGWDTSSKTLDDCWILETSQPIRFHIYKSIFNTRRFWHQMVYNWLTGDLICTGGTYEEIPGFILMSFMPKSLLRLSVDTVLEESYRTRHLWQELPAKLRDILERRAVTG